MRNLIATLFTILGATSVQASEFPPNVEMNVKTIKALIDAGSNPKNPHPLEHHFYCLNQECLSSLMAKGESLGYRAANTGTSIYEGTKYWYGDLIKEAILDLDLINQENSLMLKFANDFDADYDDWGTPVVE